MTECGYSRDPTIRFVYFIKPVGLDGPIKIGCSDRPSDRILSLGTWSPVELELIGFVPGTLADEQFMHSCFADVHSHREWFYSTFALRDAIQKVLAAKSVAVLRDTHSPKGTIRSERQRKRSRSSEHKLYISYNMRVIWAEKKLRAKGEQTAWRAADDIHAIMDAWGCHNPNHAPPSPDKIARLEEYLANPAAHSVAPNWFKPRLVSENAA